MVNLPRQPRTSWPPPCGSAASGAGITVQPDRLLPGAVRRALADVLADPAYARAARAQQAAIAALPSAADVLDRPDPAVAA